jgi:cobalt/nickel transport protein
MARAPAGWLAALLAVSAATVPARAHYHILLPDKPAADRDAAVTFTYRLGHPFEHQMFDAQKPNSVVAVAPDGRPIDLLSRLERIEVPGAEGKPVTAYRFAYTPAQRGDHVVLVRGGPVWMEDEKEFLEDTAKVALHVQTQNGWDNAAGGGLELVPLTRPYGLRAGTVFQMQLRGIGEGGVNPRAPWVLPRTLVEVERYNPTPPKELPPDEHITRAVKTDPTGVATMTLPDPGWWAITAVRDGGNRERAGKNYPVKVRCTFWVHVDDRIPLVPAK